MILIIYCLNLITVINILYIFVMEIFLSFLKILFLSQVNINEFKILMLLKLYKSNFYYIPPWIFWLSIPYLSNHPCYCWSFTPSPLPSFPPSILIYFLLSLSSFFLFFSFVQSPLVFLPLKAGFLHEAPPLNSGSPALT